MSGQLALARPSTFANAGPSKVNTKSVPAFLNKLYNMVDDPSTDPLIRWSDDGESFLVLDHEHFAREVLGRWFKHQNFASFVRQLNMYGFHKVPHLQQGVLRNDVENEVINFENSNFKRGQPDLLCLINRKKQPLTPSGDLGLLLGDAKLDSTDTSTQSPQLTNKTGAVLDVKSLVNGISAIKRHQTAISSELKNLQQSNQHLWQEAIASRERHKKNEDTINRILRFLAGVFGTTATSPNPKSPNASPSSPVVPVKRARLMIGDGRTTSNALPTWDDDGTNEDLDLPVNLNDVEDEGRFTVLEPELLRNADSRSTRLSSTPQPQPQPQTATQTPSQTPLPSDFSSSPAVQLDGINGASSSATGATLPDGGGQFDSPLPDNVLQFISSASPTEMQRLLNMFTNTSNPDIWPQTGIPIDNSSGSQLTRSPSRLEGTLPNGFDFGAQQPDPWNSLALNPDVSLSGEIATNDGLGNYQNMMQNANDLQSRIDTVDFDINSLIHNLSDLDGFTWDNDDTLNPQNPIPEVNAPEPPETSTATSATAPSQQFGNESIASTVAEGVGPGQSDQDPFGDPPPTSKEEGTGFVSELTPSQASSPSVVEDAATINVPSDKKRKATKPTSRGATKSATSKRPRTSK